MQCLKRGIFADHIFWAHYSNPADILSLGFLHWLQPWEKDVVTAVFLEVRVKVGSTQSCNCCIRESQADTGTDQQLLVLQLIGHPSECNLCLLGSEHWLNIFSDCSHFCVTELL